MKDDDDDEINEDADHPAKKVKLRDVSNRFGSVVTDGDTLATFSKGFVLDTTKSNTQWAVRTLEAWSSWRNSVYLEEHVPG